MVTMVINQILTNLPLHKKDKELLLKMKYPFEAFIQTIKREVDINNLLAVFALGIPNHAHKFISKLAKRKKIKLILTTNFDTLLEQALEAEGVKFRKLYTYESLESFRYTSDRLLLLKLHGSVENFETLGIILERVTTKTNVLSVRNSLNKLFRTGSHTSVVFIGYSCSDFFDVIPEIEKSFNSLKKIYFIKHVPRQKFITTRPLNSTKFFEKYQHGDVISTDTDKLISYLWPAINNNECPTYKSHSLRWKNQIDKWALEVFSKNEELNGIITCGTLMTFIGYYNRSLKYYEKALLIAKDPFLTEKLAKIASYSAQVHRHLGNFPMAIKCFNEALLYWKKTKNTDNYAKALSDLGSTYRLEGKGNYTKAIALQKRALQLFRETKNVKEIQNCFIILGNIYLNSKKYDKALENYKEARHLSLKISNKQSEAILLNSLGAACIKLHKLSLAKHYLKTAENISKKLGIPRIATSIEYNWGCYYLEKGEQVLAVKRFSFAYKIANNTHDIYQSSIILKNRSELYEKLNQNKKALEDVRLSLTLIKGNGSKKQEFKQLKFKEKQLTKLVAKPINQN